MIQLLSAEIYQFAIIFLRIGSALMIMPGFSSSYVNVRMRLSVALILSVILTPAVGQYIPAQPTDMATQAKIYFFEITYGIFLGVIMQMLYFVVNLFGNFAGQSSGFANAQIFDPTTQNQSIVTETFVSIIAITIIFITDLHHLMLSAVIDSYHIWPAAAELPVNDFADFLSKTMNESFIVGFKIGSPFIAFTIIFYTGMGLLSRLMPQLNIFFLSLPLQIYLGLGLLLITTPAMMMWFCRHYEATLMKFIH